MAGSIVGQPSRHDQWCLFEPQHLKRNLCLLTATATFLASVRESDQEGQDGHEDGAAYSLHHAFSWSQENSSPQAVSHNHTKKKFERSGSWALPCGSLSRALRHCTPTGGKAKRFLWRHELSLQVALSHFGSPISCPKAVPGASAVRVVCLGQPRTCADRNQKGEGPVVLPDVPSCSQCCSPGHPHPERFLLSRSWNSTSPLLSCSSIAQFQLPQDHPALTR